MEQFYLQYFNFTYLDEIEKQALEYEMNLCLNSTSKYLIYHVMKLYNKLIGFFGNYIKQYTYDETFIKCILFEYIKNTYPKFYQLYINLMIEYNKK